MGEAGEKAQQSYDPCARGSRGNLHYEVIGSPELTHPPALELNVQRRFQPQHVAHDIEGNPAETSRSKGFRIQPVTWLHQCLEPNHVARPHQAEHALVSSVIS